MNKEKNICELVWAACQEELKSCKNILVGFSGGPDSTALLHVFARLKQRGTLMQNLFVFLPCGRIRWCFFARRLF